MPHKRSDQFNLSYSNPQTITLSGTCYWCLEAMFRTLSGVIAVTQGWVSRSQKQTKITPNIHQALNQEADFVEAIVVTFDPQEISLEVLIEIHLLSHDPTKSHALKARYPSAIYVQDEQTYTQVSRILQNLQAEYKNKDQTLTTRVYYQTQFEPSAEAKQDYYFKNPQKPFCETRISPKLHQLLQSHAQYIAPDKAKIIQAYSKHKAD